MKNDIAYDLENEIPAGKTFWIGYRFSRDNLYRDLLASCSCTGMRDQVEAGLFERTPHAQESQEYLWQTTLVFLLLASDPLG